MTTYIYIRKKSESYGKFGTPYNDRIFKVLQNKNHKGKSRSEDKTKDKIGIENVSTGSDASMMKSVQAFSEENDKKELDAKSVISNDSAWHSVNGENTERNFDKGEIPFCLMRQTGRCLPQYLNLQKKYDYLKMMKDPELASEVTILPYRLFQPDMLVIFSDILLVLDAMGMDVRFFEDGPKLYKKVKTLGDFFALQMNVCDVIDKLSYVYDTIYLTKLKINNAVPVLGFCGSPFTLFMNLAKNNKNTYERSIKWIYEKPWEVQQMLDKLTAIIISHLINQIDSGANPVQIFDSCADEVDSTIFQEFSLSYIDMIVRTVKNNRPHAYIILFIKDNFHECIKHIPIDVLAITYKQLIDKGSSFFFNLFNNEIILQGALDPHVLLVEDENVTRTHTNRMLDKILFKDKYIADLGNGMLPNSKPENIIEFIKAIKEY